MANNSNVSAALQRIIAEDAVGQLRRREGLMATLGSENGELKLDWVEGVARLLAHPGMLEEVEAEARDIWQRGIRHIIWAGMGGSVLTVRVLTSLGFCGASSHETTQLAGAEQITIYPLDSTDPAALNAIARQIAGAKDWGERAKGQGERAKNQGERAISQGERAISQGDQTKNQGERAISQGDQTKNQGDRKGRPYHTTERFEDRSFLRSLLADVLMIGVSMGMTSEEPIMHLEWFADLLNQAQLPMAEHLMVMTLPGSYLDQFAKERHAPSRPLQPDGGTGTGGRMSAPATRVFLLPAALAFVNESRPPGSLRAMLRRAWEIHNLELASTQPAEHPFVRLGAAMSEASRDGACLLLVHMPVGWDALVPWLEQLMEESLGKGGKGVVVFNARGPLGSPASQNLLTVYVTSEIETIDSLHTQSDEPLFMLSQPYLAATDASERLAALAASFLGWQLSMALFGYLHGITFAGQPAVENYKARARVLRLQDNPLSVLDGWNSHYTEGMLTLFGPQGTTSSAQGDRGGREDSMAGSFARVLREAHEAQRLAYLDGTINGEASRAFMAMFEQNLRRIGNGLLRVPVKLRRAPADYHSTEQSEMDGPPSLVSLRLLARQHERSMVGRYDDTFLRAQAVSTWQAMLEQGRSCFLLVVDGALEVAIEPVARFFESVIDILES